MGAFVSHPAAPALMPSVPKKNFRVKIMNVAEVNQWRCSEESGQWLNNVDRTHIVVASGKPVVQKCFMYYIFECAGTINNLSHVLLILIAGVSQYSNKYIYNRFACLVCFEHCASKI